MTSRDALLLLFALLTLSACKSAPTASGDPAPAPSSGAALADAPTADVLQGTYRRDHTVTMLGEDDQDQDEAVQDCLALTAQGQDLAFDFALLFDRGHSCTMSGLAQRQADGSYLYTEQIEDVGTCRLIIQVQGEVVTLSDPEDTCRAHYCGARGSVDASFERHTQDMLLQKCSE